MKLITKPYNTMVNLFEMADIASETAVERFEKFIDEANEIDDKTRPARVELKVAEADIELTKMKAKLEKITAKLARKTTTTTTAP